MQIHICVKQLGKKKKIIDHVPFTLDILPTTAKELITAIVKRNVAEYNEKKVEQPLFVHLTDEQISNQLSIGKVSFGATYNENKQDVQKAIDNALICFEDGIYKLFINETEIDSLEHELSINENDSVMFIKLTMLAGRLW